MRQIISMLFFLFCINISYSQLGWTKILNADTCGIRAVRYYSVSYEPKKIIYIQYSMLNPVHSTQAMYYSWIKLNKSTNTWIINPHNSFLHSNPFYCPWPNVMAWRYYIVDNFALSFTDPNIILQTRDVPPCGPGIQEPQQDTRITYNGGSNYITYPAFGNSFLGNACGGFDIDQTNDSIMYFCYTVGNNQKAVYRSTNRGTNWKIVDTVLTIYNYGTLRINPLRRSEIFIRSLSNMLKSSDSGHDFTNVGGASFNDLFFDRVDSSIYGFSQNNIYKSTNHGNNWNVISSIPSASIRSMEINPDNHNILYAGNDSGLYRSTNSGLSWSLFNNSFMPSRRVIGISKDNGSGDTLYAVTSDAVYKVWGGFIAVGISGNSYDTPDRYSLNQNYPNPFNPVTKIRFSVPKPGFVKISIYDTLGNEIETILNDKVSSGTYDIDWDGTEYASGIYFYKLEAEGYTGTKKMILIK